MRNFVRNQMSDIGQLIALDEHLNHQIADTFASTASSELSWTEKIWSAIVRKDGTMGIDFGLGRYHNRGVMDGWGAVARGLSQWTVRASRELRDDPMITQVGPLTYEIIEPLHKVRYALASYVKYAAGGTNNNVNGILQTHDVVSQASATGCDHDVDS